MLLGTIFGLWYGFFKLTLLGLSILINKGFSILPVIISHCVLQIQIRKQNTISIVMIYFNSCTGHNAGWTVYLKNREKEIQTKCPNFLNAFIWLLILPLFEQPEILKLIICVLILIQFTCNFIVNSLQIFSFLNLNACQ